ncbi:MAG TPA: YidC/Oxa1 family insertase periplasmic-domain containing protein [Verrucomicrobiales bacterium]|nr:YidC/Oxa1 family insertase periplasmic-domain containing protein [Verrucomicrobiales bacterium]
MDRTGWIVVIVCSLGLAGFWFWNQRDLEEIARARRAAAAQASTGAEKADDSSIVAPGDPGTAVPTPDLGEGEIETPEAVAINEELRSSEVIYDFSNLGGGIATAHLLKHTAHPEGDLFINEYSSHPIGMIVRGISLPDRLEVHEMARPDAGSIVLTALNDAKLRFEKTFRLTEGAESGGDPYLLELDIRITNESDVFQQGSEYYIYTGALSLMHPQEATLYLKFNWRDGRKVTSRDALWFNGKGFLGMQFRQPSEVLTAAPPELRWAGPNNQFYTSLVIPDQVGPGRVWARRLPVELKGYANGRKTTYALHGAVGIPDFGLQPGDSVQQKFLVYTGPREYPRLARIDRGLDGIMHYDDMPVFGGMFGVIPLVSKTLLRLMVWLQSHVHNWGIAILLITFLLRLLIWPLHAKSMATMKRMAQLAPKITELKEKYSDDPQRMQKETMGLYRDYGVNPLGGCLPVFLQLPVFLGFYKMLQSAVELRDKEFLWVQDLSMPDTLFTLKGVPLLGELPVNPLPLIMAGTMLLQMAVTPKSGDKMQQRIFMFMPLIFLFICYNFASALSLYWTGQNIFAIGQMWIMNRRPAPVLEKRKPKPRFDPQAMMNPDRSVKKAKKRNRRTGG